jgi:hypothetical protein
MTMSQLLISTRKGLFVAEPAGAGYRVARAAFVGDNVTFTLADPRGGWYAARDHGHFGVELGGPGGTTDLAFGSTTGDVFASRAFAG